MRYKKPKFVKIIDTYYQFRTNIALKNKFKLTKFKYMKKLKQSGIYKVESIKTDSGRKFYIVSDDKNEYIILHKGVRILTYNEYRFYK